MKTETRHTPWIVDASGFAVSVGDSDGRTLLDMARVSRGENEIVAHHLVMCVNNHDALVEALSGLAAAHKGVGQRLEYLHPLLNANEVLAKVKPQELEQ